jgi:hypothetical protein
MAKTKKKTKTIKAALNVEIIVICPNDACRNYINILDNRNTDNVEHDDDYLLKQIFPSDGSHDDFECENVSCSQCKTTFNVKGLEW